MPDTIDEALTDVEMTITGTDAANAEILLPGMKPIPVKLVLAQEWVEDNWGRGGEVAVKHTLTQRVAVDLLYDFLTGPGVDINEYATDQPSGRISSAGDFEQYFRGLNRTKTGEEPATATATPTPAEELAEGEPEDIDWGAAWSAGPLYWRLVDEPAEDYAELERSALQTTLATRAEEIVDGPLDSQDNADVWQAAKSIWQELHPEKSEEAYCVVAVDGSFVSSPKSKEEAIDIKQRFEGEGIRTDICRASEVDAKIKRMREELLRECLEGGDVGGLSPDEYNDSVLEATVSSSGDLVCPYCATNTITPPGYLIQPGKGKCDLCNEEFSVTAGAAELANQRAANQDR